MKPENVIEKITFNLSKDAMAELIREVVAEKIPIQVDEGYHFEFGTKRFLISPEALVVIDVYDGYLEISKKGAGDQFVGMASNIIKQALKKENNSVNSNASSNGPSPNERRSEISTEDKIKLVELLKNIKELLDMGAISLEEYNKQKDDILSKLSNSKSNNSPVNETEIKEQSNEHVQDDPKASETLTEESIEDNQPVEETPDEAEEEKEQRHVETIVEEHPAEETKEEPIEEEHFEEEHPQLDDARDIPAEDPSLEKSFDDSPVLDSPQETFKEEKKVKAAKPKKVTRVYSDEERNKYRKAMIIIASIFLAAALYGTIMSALLLFGVISTGGEIDKTWMALYMVSLIINGVGTISNSLNLLMWIVKKKNHILFVVSHIVVCLAMIPAGYFLGWPLLIPTFIIIIVYFVSISFAVHYYKSLNIKN